MTQMVRMEEDESKDARKSAHPLGERDSPGKSLPIRVIRVIRGSHSRF